MKRIMILGASVLQLPAIRKAKEMGLSVVAVDMNPDAVAFQEPGVEKEIISTTDTFAVLEAAKRRQIDGVMTLASDMPMRTVAYVGAHLGLPAISEEAAFRATDKYAMRCALQEGAVPIPVFFGVATEAEFLSAIERLPGEEFIIKPADSSGSRGVHLLRRGEDILPAFADSLRFSRSGMVMVEEFMTGPEVSVEAITVRGKTEVLAITDKKVIGNGNFTEIGHAQPTRLPVEVQREIVRVVEQTIDAIGIDHSPSHTELKITPSGVKVVEIGARLGGDCITTHLVPLSTGVDMVRSCIEIAMGGEAVWPNRRAGSAAIRYFQPPMGRITAIQGVEAARSIHGVEEIVFLRGVGDWVPPICSSSDRIGFVIARGCEGRDAQEICKEAMDTIKIVVHEEM